MNQAIVTRARIWPFFLLLLLGAVAVVSAVTAAEEELPQVELLR